jgi:hypothetical protein
MVVVAIAVVIVMPIVVVIAMVFVVPMAFVDLPALLVVVVVGMGPVGAGVGWPLPDTGNPDVATAVNSPVAVDPGVALCRHGRSYLISHRWWRAEIDLDLAECRRCEGRCGDESA